MRKISSYALAVPCALFWALSLALAALLTADWRGLCGWRDLRFAGVAL